MGGSRGTAKLLRVCSDRVHSLLSKVGSPPCYCAVLLDPRMIVEIQTRQVTLYVI